MNALRELVAAELSLPVELQVSAMAAEIAAKHGDASRAVLFYGSCLRQDQLEGLMLDFYLIVSDYAEAYDKAWLATANRLIPPNVFYFEAEGLASKYAVLSEADFAHECSDDAWTVSTMARFAQPSRLVWAADDQARANAVNTISHAAPALITRTMIAMGTGSIMDFWRAAFANTFRAELRAERADRSAALIDADPDRYERFGEAIFNHHIPDRRPASEQEGRRWWLRKQIKGKLYSVARLAKASATFAGGADYIAWKINRHAGTKIELKPWQRRHPLLAGITLLPRLLKSGAIR
jgi:hypothetical protein